MSRERSRNVEVEKVTPYDYTIYTRLCHESALSINDQNIRRQKKVVYLLYIIYVVSSGYIQRYSRLDLGFFSSSAKKIPLAGPCTRDFFLPWTKKNLSFGDEPIFKLQIYRGDRFYFLTFLFLMSVAFNLSRKIEWMARILRWVDA